MIKLLRYWNKNKRKIIITIAIIALIIIIIQIANAMIKKQNENNKNHTNSPTVAEEITKPNQAIISNDKLTQKETEENSDYIQQFVDACNKRNIEEAYAFLTQECKNELYPTKEIFEKNYVDQIFQSKVNYELQLWYKESNYYTYRIIYNQGNLLETGGQLSSNNFVDYITLVKQNMEYKININKFIQKINLNKQQSNSGIEVKLNSKSIYMDYEIYNMTIQNNTQKTILLNDGTSVSDFSLLGRNNSTFNSVISEVSADNFIIDPQYKKTMNVKFNKMYMTQSKIEAMQINNIYLDKTQYDTKQENPNKIMIKIEL